jgi:hypothetical protein
MTAIVTDQLRILNAKKFVEEISSANNSYYSFVGLTNPEEYDVNWNEEPIQPRDSFNDENHIWDTIVGLKKIDSQDVKFVVKKNQWESGNTYDMYRHDITRDNLSIPSESTSLYSSNYYVVNRDYRVYICLQNGTTPENPNGSPSLDEPLFTDLEPRSAGNSGDGYVWKYLYTIEPNDIVKFDTLDYMTVPIDWETNEKYQSVRNNALLGGQLKSTIILDRGTDLGDPSRIYTGVKIIGDGVGAEATIVVNSESAVESVILSKGGSGYTYARLDLSTGSFPTSSTGNNPNIEIIIPPQYGHGYNIYRELGTTKVLVFSQIKNDLANPDFIVGNKISQIGLIANPLSYDSNQILSINQASNLKALKLVGVNQPTDFQNAIFEANSQISQTVSTGVTAYGKVVSYDKNTGVLKYWQDRTLLGYNYSNLSPIIDYTGSSKLIEFTSDIDAGGSLEITGSNVNLKINDQFNGNTESINNKNYYFGQTFTNGTATPEVKKHSGDIIYIDNRPSITRSINQREDIKIVLQF